jgi:chemotaxis protein MotB
LARKRYPEEPEDKERWLVSYADFMTLLFAFFVVMYAVSSVEDKKLKLLSNSINQALGQPSNQTKGTAPPAVAVITPELLLLQAQEQRRKLAILHETSQMKSMADALTQKLAPLVQQGQVRISQTSRGISIEINASILFAPAEARLNAQAMLAIQTVAEVLKPYPNALEIGGFTDNQTISTTEFPSNWELSAARASRVVRRLADLGISESRMRAIGYAANQPVTDNTTEQGRLRNRRVEIEILPN